jgi:RNA polymerase sigma-70 factor (ECF subfamily)
MEREPSRQMQRVEPRRALAATLPSPPEGGRLEPRELFRLHFDYVWNALRRLGVPSSDLEDLAHDTFLQVFRQYPQYDPSRPIKPWLFGFAFRMASDHRRRLARRGESALDVELVDTGASPLDSLVVAERLKLAQAALDAIELDRRGVFILHQLDGCPIPEVAESLGILVATAYSRLRLAREDFARAAQRLERRQR